MNLGSILQSIYLETSKLEISQIFQSQRNESANKRQILNNIKKQFSEIKMGNLGLAKDYQQFKESILSQINIAMGKVASSHHKLAQKKIKMEDELEKSKETQKNMKTEVMQLRQMIDEFLKQYVKEIGARDQQIHYLTDLLNQNRIYPQSKDQLSRNIREYLDPIIQQSEPTASNQTSNIGTLRSIPFNQSQVQSQGNSEHKSRSNSKRTKGFIDNFRKSIEESGENNSQETAKKTQNMKKVINADQYIKKEKKKQNLDDDTILTSKSSSSNDLGVLIETDQINIPLKCQSPKSMMFIKKKLNRIFTEENRMSTQQSEVEKQNIQQTPSLRSVSRGSSQQRYQINKSSISGSGETQRNSSKEKIKVTCKIIEDFNFRPKRKNHKHIGSVHLGNKNYVNKLKNSLKSAFEMYQSILHIPEEELKYEGQIMNSKKHGFGKLLYTNGIRYQGNFCNNLRHGKGKLILSNQQIFCDGQWQNGQLSGKCEIKSLKCMYLDCPKILSDAAYIGQLKSNKFHGNGTLFINSKEKIMMKFNQGIPIGEFTLYTQNSIDFGYWKE